MQFKCKNTEKLKYKVGGKNTTTNTERERAVIVQLILNKVGFKART